MTAVTHRRLVSPLHATRASAGALFCASFAVAALLCDHPVVLLALLGGELVAARASRVLRDPLLRRVATYALVLGVLMALVNALTARYGLTVLARLGDWGPLGQVDVTLEALAYGGMLALRVVVVVLAGALLSVVVDPDGLLRLGGRAGARSALTAGLAVRLVGVLAHDARRLQDARRCRPDGGGSGPGAQLAVLQAVTSGALERAMDVAATLESRGYGSRSVGRPARRAHAPWSSHDRAHLLAALALVGIVLAARLSGAIAFTADPELALARGPVVWLTAAAVLLVAFLPGLDRRGVVTP